MKIVTAKEMGRLESLAYKEGSLEEDFMEQAGKGVAEVVQRAIANYHCLPKILLLCGSGNNAGDAYVAGCYLLKGGFQVSALSCTSPKREVSKLCRLQSQRFFNAGGLLVEFNPAKKAPFEDAAILIDGLLGTGFHGALSVELKHLIAQANGSKLPIISVDIPSGINGSTGEVAEEVIQATETVFLGLPKSGCFLPEAWQFVGKIHIHNFGLKESTIQQGNEDYILMTDNLIAPLLPPISRIRHKYQAGYVVGIGGSLGMPGAPTMASFASLRVGAGIMRLFYPHEMGHELLNLPVEVIRQGYHNLDVILEALPKANAVFIGPGMGTSLESKKILPQLLAKITSPCVIDADALTILAEQELFFPRQAILTPHHGEMKKLLKIKEKKLPFQKLLEKTIDFAKKERVTVVLKGAPTFIIHEDQKPFVCFHGDPGMATAGSGDILTGIIAGFLAQKPEIPLHAALLGVQFHAMAGEDAASKWSSYAMIATDILDHLPAVFKHFMSLLNRNNSITESK